MGPEDAEIAFLERKLGMKGNGGRKKVYSEMNDDGFGADFGAFLGEIDGLSDRVRGREGESSAPHEPSDADDMEQDYADLGASANHQAERLVRTKMSTKSDAHRAGLNQSESIAVCPEDAE
eukprot:CAMPEP_0185755542 /NCGR_PEP_ID=MMETSP1174-20130828/14020_1 /TAXON_ID=35687 /ORGANISM="Dictyocha speculum, Strain CCMP1381" /LENGTH=120 /DNA_ID=CAMNT_0028434123 /DNA_START=108 /DNA_END=467 /DNA_ORIENTATION=-